MKKILFVIALVFTLSAANAQKDGFFSWNGNDEDDIYRDVTTSGLVLPASHGFGEDTPSAPVGSGLLILTALGTAYALKKKREK